MGGRLQWEQSAGSLPARQTGQFPHGQGIQGGDLDSGRSDSTQQRRSLKASCCGRRGERIMDPPANVVFRCSQEAESLKNPHVTLRGLQSLISTQDTLDLSRRGGPRMREDDRPRSSLPAVGDREALKGKHRGHFQLQRTRKL